VPVAQRHVPHSPAFFTGADSLGPAEVLTGCGAHLQPGPLRGQVRRGY
jgi:hypothetical protein